MVILNSNRPYGFGLSLIKPSFCDEYLSSSQLSKLKQKVVTCDYIGKYMCIPNQRIAFFIDSDWLFNLRIVCAIHHSAFKSHESWFLGF